MNHLTNEQLLARLWGMSKTVNLAGKPGMSAEKQRADIVKECLKRGILGMKSKRKFREI